MNLFSWMILSHFVADWLFQNDWMAIGKRRRFLSLSGMLHYGLYTAVIMLVLVLQSHTSNSARFVYVGIFIFLSHWIIDGTNIIHTWMRFFGQRHQLMVYIVIDQTLHLVILGIIATLLSS